MFSTWCRYPAGPDPRMLSFSATRNFDARFIAARCVGRFTVDWRRLFRGLASTAEAPGERLGGSAYRLDQPALLGIVHPIGLERHRETGHRMPGVVQHRKPY